MEFHNLALLYTSESRQFHESRVFPFSTSRSGAVGSEIPSLRAKLQLQQERTSNVLGSFYF